MNKPDKNDLKWVAGLSFTALSIAGGLTPGNAGIPPGWLVLPAVWKDENYN